jgi:hypothetical protein
LNLFLQVEANFDRLNCDGIRHNVELRRLPL